MKLLSCFTCLLIISAQQYESAWWKSQYCLQPSAHGTCEKRVASWYYDIGIQNCKMFFYTGWGGNQNRFSSEGWCQWYCLPRNKMRKNVCSRREYGEKCYGRTERWYFYYKTNTCRQFRDGYCGLVPNRFNSCRECVTRCSDADPNIACAEPKKSQPMSHINQLEPFGNASLNT